MPTSNRTFLYKKPSPHIIPQVFFRQDNPVVLTAIPRETLHYSSIVIEEIMHNINLEYEARGRTKPTWKRYKAGIDDFATFVPNPNTGRNVARIPVKFFPQIVKDIQISIEGLISETKYPDDKGSYFARILGDNTIHNGPGTWSNSTRINNGYIVPATNESGQQTLNPLNIIIGAGADWPFPVDVNNYRGTGHVENPLPRMGVDFKGTQHVRNQAGSIESKASDFPASVIGKRRTEQNIARINNILVPKAGSSITGIDGIDIPMRAEGRPGPHSRRNEQNTSLGFGAGNEDVDAGYSFLAHHPLIIQQLRFQPPIVERFDGPNTIPNRHYTQRIYSNNTINLPYIFANPVERKWTFNWGDWLVKGRAQSDLTGLTLTAPPDQFEGHIVTECPFSVFFPPSSVNCSCGAGDTSYAVWGAGGLSEVLTWENSLLLQNGNPNTLYKRIGPKTRLRLKHTYTPAVGSPGPKHYYAVLVRITSIAGVNDQPFIPIFVSESSDPETSLASFIDVKNITTESHTDNSKSINIMEAIKKSYPQHSGNGDTILAMAIFVHQSVSGSKVCDVMDVSGGSIIDPACPPTLQCTMGTITSKTEYLMLYEPSLSGINDVRLP